MLDICCKTIIEKGVFMNDLMNFDDVEFDTDNPDPRISVCFVLDCSDSMEMVQSGESRSALQALNGGLDTLVAEISKDVLAKRRVELSFIPYGTDVAAPTPFSTVDNIVLPELSPMGITNTGKALTVALDEIDARKKIYRTNGVSYYQPMLFLISDGLSMDSLTSPSERIKELENKRKLSFFSIGVEGADMEQLGSIGTRKALGLKGLKFDELFEWISQSTGAVSQSSVDSSDKVAVVPPSSDWASI